MRRVKILYEDGANTYGELCIESEKPTIIVGGEKYELSTFATTKATVAVNDEESLRVLHSHGVRARPTGKQTIITISVPASLKERLKKAAIENGNTTTGIMTIAASEWLERHGY